MKYIVGTVAKSININMLFSEIITRISKNLLRMIRNSPSKKKELQTILYGAPPRHGIASNKDSRQIR